MADPVARLDAGGHQRRRRTGGPRSTELAIGERVSPSIDGRAGPEALGRRRRTMAGMLGHRRRRRHRSDGVVDVHQPGQVAAHDLAHRLVGQAVELVDVADRVGQALGMGVVGAEQDVVDPDQLGQLAEVLLPERADVDVALDHRRPGPRRSPGASSCRCRPWS